MRKKSHYVLTDFEDGPREAIRGAKVLFAAGLALLCLFCFALVLLVEGALG